MNFHQDKIKTVSVIIPTLNQGKFIRECIDSILKQEIDLKEIGIILECIVIDGQSTDDTIEILKSFGSKIKFKSEKDTGQSDAINKGIKICRGDIVTFLNSDDISLPGSIKVVVETFQISSSNNNNSTKFVIGDYIIIDSNGKPIRSWIGKYKKFMRERLTKYFGIKNVLFIVNFIIQPGTFWKRIVHDDIGYFNESLHYCMDYEFWLRALDNYHNKPFVIISNPLAKFRIHDNSKGKRQFIKQFREEYQIGKIFNKNIFINLLHFLHVFLAIIIYSIINLK